MANIPARVVVDDKIPGLQGIPDRFLDVSYFPWQLINHRNIADAEALIIRTRTRCDRELLEGTSVKFIATATSGSDHIDLDYCHSAGIEVYTALGCNSTAVAEYVITSVLNYHADKELDLYGKTLGIIGAGNVGGKVATLAEKLGMKVILNDPPRQEAEGGSTEFFSLEALLSASDILTFHVPLTKTGKYPTFLMGNARFFDRCLKRPLVINTSRGEVVDELALKAALENRQARDCILDVWNNEPFIDASLIPYAHISTPHIAGYSLEGKINASVMVLDAVSRFFDIPVISSSGILRPGGIEISHDCSGYQTMNCIAAITEKITGLKSISRSLKKTPSGFEQIRMDYPLRREFGSHHIRLQNATDKITELVKQTGFKLMK